MFDKEFYDHFLRTINYTEEGDPFEQMTPNIFKIMISNKNTVQLSKPNDTRLLNNRLLVRALEFHFNDIIELICKRIIEGSPSAELVTYEPEEGHLVDVWTVIEDLSIDFLSPESTTVETYYSPIVTRLRKRNYSDDKIESFLLDQVIIDFMHDGSKGFTDSAYNHTSDELATLIKITRKRRLERLPLGAKLVDFLVSTATRCLDEKGNLADNPCPLPKRKTKVIKPYQLQYRMVFMILRMAEKENISLEQLCNKHNRQRSKLLDKLLVRIETWEAFPKFKRTATKDYIGLNIMIDDVLEPQIKT